MNLSRSFAFLATASLAAALAIGGCKANNNAPATSQSAQPAQSAPSSTPDASQPSSGQAPPPPSGQAPPPPSGRAGAPPAAAPSYGAPPPPPAAPAGSQQAYAPAPPPPPAVVSLPAGTEIQVRLDSDLGSGISHAGDAFSATVAQDVLVDGQVVIPREARADGVVVDAKSLGHFKGGALLSIRLDRVTTRWGSYPVESSSISRAEKGKGKRTGLFAGGGAAFGALIGGLAGGGKGALIGGLAGAGAGTAGGAMTGNKQIMLPAETLLTFRLEHSVHISEQGQQDPSLQQR
jgi:hypothetical protein